MIHGRVLPDQELDGLLRGDPTQEGTDVVNVRVTVADHLDEVLVVEADRGVVVRVYSSHDHVHLGFKQGEVLFDVGLSVAGVAALVVVTEGLHCAEGYVPGSARLWVIELAYQILVVRSLELLFR